MEYQQYSTSQRSPRDTSKYALAKSFPNNYTSLTLRADYILPDAKSYLMKGKGTSRYFLATEQELKMAGLRIFSMIMLNAWRRRREDVKTLQVKMEELKKGTMKTKNQIHVYNTLFRVEQRRNDELTCQLKRSMEGVNQARSSCESLTTSIISLKADKALLEQELQTKFKDLDAITDVLAQTKNDLICSVMDQRQLVANLKKEQRNVNFLECQKNKLINELVELGSETRKLKENHRKEIEQKDNEISEANEKIKLLEDDLYDLRKKAFDVDEICETDARLKMEVQLLQEQVIQLQKSLEETLGNRLHICWRKLQYFQKTTLQLAHLLAYFLLPATPPPKFTFAFNKGYLKMSI